MRIQVLVATMHQRDYSLLDKLNLQTDSIVVNQCDRDGEHCFLHNGHEIIWIDSTERGLSRSRNMAMKRASADICILCDDDEKLAVDYQSMVENAYRTLAKADVIAFNINRTGQNKQEKAFRKPKRIGRFKTYGSVHISFRRKRVVEQNIKFDTRFGTGSDMYLSAEDAIFCMDCHKAGFGMYTYPGILGEVTCETSTWFTGFDEGYFYDAGAYLSATFPHLKNLFKWYYPIRCRRISGLSAISIISAINKGIMGYSGNMSYKQFRDAGE